MSIILTQRNEVDYDGKKGELRLRGLRKRWHLKAEFKQWSQMRERNGSRIPTCMKIALLHVQ